jgi:hypothetical protein
MVMANMDYDGNGFLTPDEIRITLKGEAALSTTDIGALLKRGRSRLDALMPAISGLGKLLGLGP